VTRALRLIVNPFAGRGRARRALPAVERRLLDLGVTFRTERTTSLEHAIALAREAAAAGEVAAAMGGDGLIGAVAGALRGSEGVLGVLPGGRGNDFARVLGLPLDPVGACDVLARGEPRTVDLAEVDGRVFIGIASVGFDSDANRIANETRWIRGNLVYMYGALRALGAWTPARFEVALDGRPRQVTGYTVAVANTKAYGGGMFMAPDAELDDGLLDVVVVEDMPKRQALSLLPRVFKGAHVESAHVHVQRAREVRISADRPFAVYADGDPVAELPATVRVLPDALSVLVSTSR
jgi:YegS/Rv2252/BmrU family lipid kinase